MKIINQNCIHCYTPLRKKVHFSHLVVETKGGYFSSHFLKLLNLLFITSGNSNALARVACMQRYPFGLIVEKMCLCRYALSVKLNQRHNDSLFA